MTKFSTGLDFMRSQDKKLDEIIRNNVPLQKAATEAHRLMVKRIFEQGKDAAGGEIKNPSTTPIYINPDNSPKKFAPVGKGEGGKATRDVYLQRANTIKMRVVKVPVTKQGDRKTKYFAGGYAEFKRLIDRPKLVLFGQMRNDFRAGIKKLNQSTWVSYFKNDVNAKKAAGIEARYQHGKIFSPTKSEIETFKRILVEDTNKLMKGIEDD